MIVDCFPFGGEADLLELRLELMWDRVDLFVISEVGQTHSGVNKPLILSPESSFIQKYGAKIEVVSATRFPEGLGTFERDWWQRQLPASFLNKTLQPGDFLIYGDVDELPRPEAVDEAINRLRQTDATTAVLAQELYFVWMNYREVSGRLLSPIGEFPNIRGRERRWLGSAIWKWDSSLTESLVKLRDRGRLDLTRAVRIPSGGWHFSYVSGSSSQDGYSRFISKLGYSAHQEFNTDEVKARFWNRIHRRKDPLGRRWVKFVVDKDLNQLPPAISANPERFIHQLLLEN